MKVVSIGHVNGDLEISYDNLARVHDFLYKNKNKKIRVVFEEVDKKIADEKRGYFEGAIVPVFTHFQNKERIKIGLKEYTRGEMREILKREFNGRIIQLTSGKNQKFGQSTNTLSNKRFARFLDKITSYMEENGIPIPDPEEYKKWRDENAQIGQNYFKDVWLPLHDPDYVNI